MQHSESAPAGLGQTTFRKTATARKTKPNPQVRLSKEAQKASAAADLLLMAGGEDLDKNQFTHVASKKGRTRRYVLEYTYNLSELSINTALSIVA